MEEETDEDVEVLMETFTPLRFLIQRATFLLRQEDQEEIERQMMDVALRQSMDTYHESLFQVDEKLKPLLQSFVYKKDDVEEGEEGKCFVCLGGMEEGEMAVRLPCGHVFHSDCTKDMVTHQHGSCPLCRSSIPVERELSPPPQAQEECGGDPK